MALVSNWTPDAVHQCRCGSGSHDLSCDSSVYPDDDSPTGWTIWQRHLDGSSCRLPYRL